MVGHVLEDVLDHGRRRATILGNLLNHLHQTLVRQLVPIAVRVEEAVVDGPEVDLL